MKLSLRGIGVWLVTLYLVELGGQEIEPGWVVGEGWQAHVVAGEPAHIGSIRLGVTEVQLSGEEGTVKAILPGLKRKALRAGG